jgi:hypothetical protein
VIKLYPNSYRVPVPPEGYTGLIEHKYPNVYFSEVFLSINGKLDTGSDGGVECYLSSGSFDKLRMIQFKNWLAKYPENQEVFRAISSVLLGSE